MENAKAELGDMRMSSASRRTDIIVSGGTEKRMVHDHGQQAFRGAFCQGDLRTVVVDSPDTFCREVFGVAPFRPDGLLPVDGSCG